MSTRPVIGITTYVEPARWGHWELDAALLPYDYVRGVARGGDLVQHLPEVVGDEKHREVRGVFSEHPVRIDDGSRLGSLLGGGARVKSHHHQGLGAVGAGLREVAWADDGTVEALEDPACRFALGVLWHPEAGEDTKLFEALVAEARAYREARRG